MEDNRNRPPAASRQPPREQAETPPRKTLETGPSGTPGAHSGMDADIPADGAYSGNTARFRLLFDSLPGGACVVKASGSGALLSDYRITDINAAGLRMSNKERAAIIGRPMNELPVLDNLTGAPLLQGVLQAQGTDETVHTSRQTDITLRIRAFRLAEDELGILFDDVTEQESVKRRLVESEQKYREIENNLTDVVWQSDLANKLTYISPSIKRLTGMSPDEYKSRPFTEMYPPDAAKTIRDAINDELDAEDDPGARKDRSRIVEVQHRLPDGRVVWLAMHIALLRDADGKACGVQGIARNITARKAAEALLRESEERHRLLFESMLQGAVYRDTSGLIVSVNPALLRITGFEEHELLGRHALPDRFDHIREDGTPFPMDEFPSRITLRTGEPCGPVVMGGRHGKTGNRVWFSMNAIPVFRKGESAPQIYTIFDDITDRKNAEQALTRSRDMMRYVVEHSGSSIAVLDRDMRYLYISRQYMDEWYSKESDVIGRGHYELNPHMPERWKEAHRRALAGETLSAEEDLNTDPEGNPLWIRWACRPWYNDSNAIGGIILYAENITSRKSMEEALRLSEEKYRLIAENVSDAIWVFNVDRDRFTFISPSVARMTGFTAEETLAAGSGKEQAGAPFPLQADHIEASVKALRESPAGARTLMFENRRAMQNRPDLWTEDAMTARYNTAGEVEIFGVSRDISARKENEENLRYMSYHDQLTGLYNCRFFEEELARLDTPRRYPLSIIMGDVNGLKIVNDSFGHKAGDELLARAAEVFRKACRADDIIARLSGDEFVIILPETSYDAAEQVIARIKSLASDIKVSDIDLSIAFGCSTKADPAQSIRDVLADMENRMYRHKLYERKCMRSTAVDAIMNALFRKSSRELLHSKRVGELCRVLAARMGFEKDAADRIGIAGMFHDIGKIGVDEKILNKNGRLTDEEWPEIRRHPETGWRILSATAEYNELARHILEHQENWDGSGYPKGLRHEEISREARIIRIADSYDAMTHARAFRDGLSRESAAEELRRNSGTQFDPAAVEAFLRERIPEELE